MSLATSIPIAPGNIATLSKPTTGRIDRMACGNITHSSMSESGVTRLQFRHKFMNFFFKRLRFGAGKDLLSPTLGKRVPVHAVHAWIEMLLQHQVADLIED